MNVQGLRSLEGDTGCPGPGVTGGCGLPSVSSGNRIQVICKDKFSELLSHLSSPPFQVLKLELSLLFEEFKIAYNF